MLIFSFFQILFKSSLRFQKFILSFCRSLFWVSNQIKIFKSFQITSFFYNDAKIPFSLRHLFCFKQKKIKSSLTIQKITNQKNCWLTHSLSSHLLCSCCYPQRRRTCHHLPFWFRFLISYDVFFFFCFFRNSCLCEFSSVLFRKFVCFVSSRFSLLLRPLLSLLCFYESKIFCFPKSLQSFLKVPENKNLTPISIQKKKIFRSSLFYLNTCTQKKKFLVLGSSLFSTHKLKTNCDFLKENVFDQKSKKLQTCAPPCSCFLFLSFFFPFRKRTSLIKLLLSLFCVFRNLRLLLRLFLSRNFFFFSPFFSGFSTFVLFLFFCTPFSTRAIFNTKQQNLPLFSSLF